MVLSFLGFLFLCHVFSLPPPSTCYADPSISSFVSFNEGFNPLYGFPNVKPYDGGKSVSITMDENSSSGFYSKSMYKYGYYSVSIKLPQNYTAGVVVTFYTSNNEKYPKNHDEIDFEFLGHTTGRDWIVQTNFYGNGSTLRGREERYILWFDPSQDFHQYSILWTENVIIYYVDDVPVRAVERNSNMGGDWPSKPMTLYGTIWDGSGWATNGGKHKLNLKYSPFIANYSNFMLNGCPVDPVNLSPKCSDNPQFPTIPRGFTPDQRNKMEEFRRKHVIYSYCHDKNRYPLPLPECVIHSQVHT